jgi:hypothetical protein
MNILVCDDDKEIVEAIKIYLSSDQHIDKLQRITRHAISVITEHKSRDKILSGEAISEDEYARKEYDLYLDFVDNSSENKDFFKSQPSYLINDSKETSIFPENIKNNPLYNELLQSIEDDYTTDNISVNIALTKDYLNDSIVGWITTKESKLKEIYILIILAVGLLLCLISCKDLIDYIHNFLKNKNL